MASESMANEAAVAVTRRLKNTNATTQEVTPALGSSIVTMSEE